MKNDILRIIGIICFFAIIGYLVTYPYKVNYEGSSDIVLIENTEKYKTIDDVIQHPKLQNSFLYITVWDFGEKSFPVWFEEEDYTERINELKLKIAQNDENNRIKFSDSVSLRLILNNQMKLTKGSIASKDYLSGLENLQKRYNGKNIKVVFLDYPDAESDRIKDDIRKWKNFLKKHEIKGYHFLASRDLFINTRKQIETVDKKLFFPYRLLVNTYKEIIDYNAPAPSLEQKELYKSLDSLLLNTKSNDRHTSKQH